MSIVARVMIVLIRGYQLTLSAFLGRQCRYLPTCSEYAREAVERYGAFGGAWLAVRRIGRCHPWGGSGYDPVPEKTSRQKKSHRDSLNVTSRDAG
jgi:putative membrane protein insertion efficiency factor